jgi:hypothetical protein
MAFAGDLEESVNRLTFDNAHMRRQLDGRREPLLGHAEVRLTKRVREVTGRYSYRLVASVLDDLRTAKGLEGRDADALKKRVQRWQKRLSGKDASEG